MTKANRRKRRRASLPPYESSEQLEARLRAYALATREWAIEAAKIPFPENISVLAGPLRRVEPKKSKSDATDAPAAAQGLNGPKSP
ncbi:hypothetical protein SAMN05446935_8027 [Burkholderia sp. YR290]|nr:hypothetical protein SAMN05446935_8027 [Burkholderia sp. YR290]